MKFLVAMALAFVVSSTGEGIEELALKEADPNSDHQSIDKSSIDHQLSNLINEHIDAKMKTPLKRIAALEKDVPCKIGSFMLAGSGSGESGFKETRAVHFSGFKSRPQFVASLYNFGRNQQGSGDTYWGINLSFRASSASQASITVKGVSTYVRNVGVSWIACQK